MDRKTLALLLATFLTAVASADYHYWTEEESGWSTGLRQNINASLEITGSAIGEGTYSRYTEMNLNQVRMRERISASEGTLDSQERISLWADDTAEIESTLVKHPGNQNYQFRLNETWPVHLNASRSMDYQGRRISDREFFGNNFDWLGAGFLYTTDLVKDRQVSMDLNNTWFYAVINDTTDGILDDRFSPNKTIDYHLRSRSTGLADLRFKETRREETVREGWERYLGSFSIDRRIRLSTWFTPPPGGNETEEGTEFLGCCPELLPVAGGSVDGSARSAGASDSDSKAAGDG
ncbi:MAG: hypothetical protein GKC10_00020 [Methanosarcinales archaeon]|nr:hypothetical protein [Methanosarcinales archaeon]